ncbi:MAG TPA: GspE/PulE family protein [Acidimicrobiales bacterium]|nr:GspE/PulE family protein [Acidimicrobiales bacterium]
MSPVRRSRTITKAPVENGFDVEEREPQDNDSEGFAQLLVSMGLTTPEAAAAALARNPTDSQQLAALLVEAKRLDEGQLAQLLAQQLGLQVVDLGRSVPDKSAITAVPERIARKLVAVPIRATEAGVDVAAAHPVPDVQWELEQATGRAIQLYVAPASDIRRIIDSSYRVLGDVDRLVQTFEASTPTRTVAEPAQADVSDDAPVVQVVNLILTQALRDRASDVHIEPQGERLRIRYRIDGALNEMLDLPGTMAPALVSRLKIMADMNIVERRRSQDGQFAITLDGRSLDVRVATTATIWGEKCVLRLLDKTRPLYKLSDLGMPDDTAERFSQLVRSPFGMVICAGPTGSGKTTSLYATLNEINEPYRNIMTIEDPVEYVFTSINQIQTNEQAGLTFADGLKAILRQDPDVILVGEIRDAETARIATQSALTGHLVLSSLHATDSAAALHRFLDMGIEAFLISSSVLAVVAQRLVRRICVHCMEAYEPTVEELTFYQEAVGEGHERTTPFMRGAGCNFCAASGYQDRTGVYELLRITPEIRRLVVGWATQEEIRRLAVSQGMRTLLDEAISLVDQDVTTITEVIRTIYT